jgi:16S rRNA processing protein RimM
VSAEHPPPLFAVGRLARAHGIRGRVLVAPFNDQSDGLERVSALWLGERGAGAQGARRYDVLFAERVNLGYLFQLRGVDERNGAEALRGLEVSVLRDELPALGEGELYAADLLGLQVFDARADASARAPLGEVIALEQAGPNELLVIKLQSGEEVLAPLALLRDVDAEKRALLLEVPDGLFEAQRTPGQAPPEEDIS